MEDMDFAIWFMVAICVDLVIIFGAIPALLAAVRWIIKKVAK